MLMERTSIGESAPKLKQALPQSENARRKVFFKPEPKAQSLKPAF
jgi:hypothetical protein